MNCDLTRWPDLIWPDLFMHHLKENSITIQMHMWRTNCFTRFVAIFLLQQQLFSPSIFDLLYYSFWAYKNECLQGSPQEKSIAPWLICVTKDYVNHPYCYHCYGDLVLLFLQNYSAVGRGDLMSCGEPWCISNVFQSPAYKFMDMESLNWSKGT